MITLNSEVFPAPLGPINAVMCPWRAVSETLLTAVSPPNFLVTSVIVRVDGCPCLRLITSPGFGMAG